MSISAPRDAVSPPKQVRFQSESEGISPLPCSDEPSPTSTPSPSMTHGALESLLARTFPSREQIREKAQIREGVVTRERMFREINQISIGDLDVPELNDHKLRIFSLTTLYGEIG